jgi:D-aspartate ligase
MCAVQTLPRAVVLDPNDGGITIARQLAARGVEVVTVCPPRGRWASRSRAADCVPVGPLPEAADEWVEALGGLADRPGVLVSCSDAATEWLVEHRDRIPTTLTSFEGTGSAHLRLMDKWTLLGLAHECGVRAPLTHRVETRADLEALVGTGMPMPCVAKAVLGHEARRLGDFATKGVPDVATLVAHVGAALDRGLVMLVTEQIPGSPESLEGAVHVRTASGDYALEYGRRKVRDLPVGYGIGTLTEVVDVPEALATARRLLDGAGYVGLASTEFKRHSGTGELVLIEVNVRAPQSFGLAQAAGVDGPWRLYATLAGLPLGPQPPAHVGAKVWLPQVDLHAVRELRRRGQLSAGDVMRSLRGVRDHGAFSWRDPRPGLTVLAAELRDFTRHRLRR